MTDRNLDPREIAKFEALASRWWDPEGDFRPLHDLNPVRLDYIRSHADLTAGPVLDGVTQQLVRDNLDVPQRHRAVRVDELDGFRGAFFLNSQCACQPIGAIDAVEYAVPPDAVAAFERAWGRVSWAPVTAYLT